MSNLNHDKCIECGKDTGYSINDHIDSRKGYIEGAGQLCSECFLKIFKKVQEKDVDTNEES